MMKRQLSASNRLELNMYQIFKKQKKYIHFYFLFMNENILHRCRKENDLVIVSEKFLLSGRKICEHLSTASLYYPLCELYFMYIVYILYKVTQHRIIP